LEALGEQGSFLRESLLLRTEGRDRRGEMHRVADDLR